MSLLESVIKHEGFEGKPYRDTLGVWTFGHGLTYITEEESMVIVKRRLVDLTSDLAAKIDGFYEMPQAVRDVLVEMAYQMGIVGTLRFKKFLQALKDKEYVKAADEGLDSQWARQTPNRAKELMDRVRRAQ